MRSWRTRFLFLALVASALPVLAQTTGMVAGRILDAKGAPVAGATVRLSGGGIQGVRATSSDQDGGYRFTLLNPGRCTVTATKDGLRTAKADAVVGLDKTATVNLTMGAVASATVEVVEQSTTVDVRATTTGANYDSETFTKLPTTRDFANIAILAPGVTQDDAGTPGGGLKIYGGTGAENSYVVDGINTTNVEFGTQGKTVPIEFIQEFQVKTGGYEAEYGKALGGIINVITKSGGNEFTGDLFTYFDGNSLRANNKHKNETFVPVDVSRQRADYGFDFGGPIIKDKLWFFVAYDRNTIAIKKSIAGSTDGATAPLDKTQDLFAGKLTWRLTDTQTLIASFVGDPGKDIGAVYPPLGPTSTWDGENKIGGTDFSLRYEINGESWFAQIQLSKHKETNSRLPQGSNGRDIQYIDNSNNGLKSGGFGRFDDKDFTRDTITGSITKYFGGHEIKAGFDFQTDKADIKRGFSGGQTVTIYDNSVHSNQPIYAHYYWTVPDWSLTPPINVPILPVFMSKPKHESQAYFLQDKWTLNSHWNFNLGLRLDQTDIKDVRGVKVISLKDELAPRLGVIYDWKGKGQDKLYASFSRFYEQVPLDLVIRSFSAESNPTIINYDRTSITPNAAAESDFGTPSSVVGAYFEPVDHDLKGAYNDEFILGAETTLNNRYVLGAKFIRRYLGRAIEDGLDAAQGDYFIMNPGQSHEAGVRFPQAIRDYKGVELTAQRKFADNYTWQLSYLWSKLDGNYEGAYQGIGGGDGTGQLDPNINSAFDLPEFLVNSYGPLSGDRQGEFKANGYYEFSFGLSVGASLSYLTGTPVSRLGYHNGYGRYELFLQPRGSEGRTPTVAKLDINLAYVLKFSGKKQVRFMLDAFNLLDSQTATSLDQRFNFQEGDPQTNDNYRRGNAFQAPRSIRLGVRFTF